MAQIINGLVYADQLKKLITQELVELGLNSKPRLAIIQVADNPASEVYVRTKIKQAEEVGITAHPLHFPESVSQENLLKLIDTLNADPNVHGIIVQLPLPGHLDPLAIVNRIRDDKDVDGLSSINAGRLSLGLDCLVPCTPLGCVIMLEFIVQNLAGQNAVIIGRSNLVGKPLAQMLLQKDCTVSVLHSKTKNPELLTCQADILISAVGSPELVKAHWVKPGAIVLDVGTSRLDNGKLTGDVDFAAVEPVAGFVTPVPGGVGPMTVACLLLNTVLAMTKQNNLKLKHLTLNPLRESICLS